MKAAPKYAGLMAFCFVAIFYLTPAIQAADFTTPLFPTTNYHFDSLSYLLEKDDDVTLPSISLQTKTDKNNPDSWQELNEKDFLCQREKQQLFCQVPLNINWQQWGQIKITYTNNANLKFLNLQKQTNEPLTQTIDVQKNEHYSSLKTFSQPNEFRALGWQAVDLVPEASSATLIQYRSTYDGQHWSDWQGNYHLQNLDSNQYVLDDPHTLTINVHGDWLLLNYRDQKGKRQANQVFATGSEETAAFLSRTLIINQLDDLQIGQNLIISEQVGDTLFSVQTMIADINVQTHEVTTNAFHGSIPRQNPQLCGNDYHYCFTTAATIYPVRNTLLAINQKRVSLPQPMAIADLRSVAILKSAAANSHPYTMALNLPTDIRQRLPTLQYRLILPEMADRLIKEVYLLPDFIKPEQLPSTTKGRLRSGKNFASGMGKPSIWQ